jgi:hypothetical protein
MNFTACENSTRHMEWSFLTSSINIMGRHQLIFSDKLLFFLMESIHILNVKNTELLETIAYCFLKVETLSQQPDIAIFLSASNHTTDCFCLIYCLQLPVTSSCHWLPLFSFVYISDCYGMFFSIVQINECYYLLLPAPVYICLLLPLWTPVSVC